jgi:heme A synthase
MLRPEQLIRVVIELLFVLLGGLVVWLGLTNQIFADPRKPTWMILAVALIAWGAYAFARPSRGWLSGERWTRGVSLILLGVLMLAIAHAPFGMIGKLFAVAGVILALRGLVGMGLILRSR